MASGTIKTPMPQAYHLGRMHSGSAQGTIDLTPYVWGEGVNAGRPLMIILKSWATTTDRASVYMYCTIQRTNYAELVLLGKNANGPTATVSGTTLTITWPDTNGGMVDILKIY